MQGVEIALSFLAGSFQVIPDRCATPQDLGGLQSGHDPAGGRGWLPEGQDCVSAGIIGMQGQQQRASRSAGLAAIGGADGQNRDFGNGIGLAQRLITLRQGFKFRIVQQGLESRIVAKQGIAVPNAVIEGSL